MKIYLIRSIFFLLVFFSIFFITGLNKTLILRPQSIHQWAQCDRASVALNFSRDTYNIFKPQIHFQSRGDGITGMEFPFVNYIVGMLYRLFGFHEAIYRIIMSFILALGLLAAFTMSFLLLKNIYYSFYSLLLFLLSPVLFYYTPNFIPDTAGLGLILIGWYFYFRWQESNIPKHLLYVVLFSTLSCLIKITGIISVVTMLIIVLFTDKQNQVNKNKNSFNLLALSIPIILSASWYYYAHWLSIKHGSAAFLLHWRPVQSMEQLESFFFEIKNKWFKQYYSRYIYFLFLISITIIILLRKNCNKQLFNITLLLWTGNILFFIMMLEQFPDHDYYIISLIPAVLFQFLTFFSSLKTTLEKRTILRKAMLVVLFALTIHGIIFCKKTIHDRYRADSWMVSNPVFNNYFHITPYARSLGIEYNDLVLSANDPSFDISLYLMDSKGITLSMDSKPNDIESAYYWKPKYLILNDSSHLGRYLIPGFSAYHLGTQNNIYFYRLTNKGKPNE